MRERAFTLWNVWDHDPNDPTYQHTHLGSKLWRDVPAPGYRMLTSFPCCPRYMRPLMSPALLKRSRLTAEGRMADKWGSLPQWLVDERQDAERASDESSAESITILFRHGGAIEDMCGWTMSTT